DFHGRQPFDADPAERAKTNPAIGTDLEFLRAAQALGVQTIDMDFKDIRAADQVAFGNAVVAGLIAVAGEQGLIDVRFVGSAAWEKPQAKGEAAPREQGMQPSD